jgi:quercetin dioxygenase-like cupin family protein
VPVPAAVAALLLAGVWFTVTRAGSTSTATLPETAASRPSGELARYALSGPLEGFDAVLVEVNFRPGGASQEHRHPGFILGYVVDGQIRFGINHEPEQIVPAGGTFFEPLGALHTTFGAASRDTPTRAVVFLVVPSGSPLTGPA